MPPDRPGLQPLRSQERPAAGELAAWELLRGVDTEITVSELSGARILARIGADISFDARRPRQRAPRWLMAAAAALSLLGGQIAAAAVLFSVPSLRHALGAAVAHRLASGGMMPQSASMEAGATGTRVPAPPADVPPAPSAAIPPTTPPPLPAPAPLAAIPRRATKRPVTRTLPMASSVEPITASSRPEVEVMTQAARELYADHDAVAALATLEPYLYLHPAGVLRPEMIREAVQADLDLDRTPEALGLLDGLAAQNFVGIPRASELRLLRAELLARNDRCREALPTFEQSLAGSDPRERERALYGRAVCRAELGDADGSQADLRAYLEQFPGGRFAGEAERALDHGR